MITIRKRVNFGYPVRQVYFPLTPEAIGVIHPLEVIQCQQASDEVVAAYCHRSVSTRKYHTLLSDLTQSTDDLWKRVEHPRRCKVLQAESLPIDVRKNTLPPETVQRMVETFYVQKGLYQPRCNYFRRFCEHCDILSVYHNDELALIHVVMRDYPHRVMVYFSCYSFESQLSNSVRGSINCYLHWWEVMHYREQGFHYYDWGGVSLDPSSSAYGVTQFKKKFGGVIHQEWDMLLLGDLVRPLWPLANRLMVASNMFSNSDVESAEKTKQICEGALH